MSSIRKKILASGTRVLDILIMVITFLLSLYVQAPEEAPRDVIGFLSLKVNVLNVFVLIVFIIGWNRLFAFFGLYEVRRLGNRWYEMFDIIKAVSTGTLLLAAAGAFLPQAGLHREIIITFWAVTIVLSVISRTVVREFLVCLRNHGRNLRFIVFVGSGPRAAELAQKMIKRRELGYRLLGFVDDDFKDSLIEGLTGLRRLCSLKEFAGFLQSHVVDEVFIVLPVKSYYKEIYDIANICQEMGIICRVPSDLFVFKTALTFAYELDGVPILEIYTGSRNQFDYLWLKRLIDLVISSILLIILSPLFSAVAIAIKFDSNGPVFFKQERVGYNRRRFKMYKFRSMVANAEELQPKLEPMNEADGPAFKIIDDPRITPMGRCLRRMSIDELPQLINVLRGEMSLVGPRPLPLRDVNGFDQRWQNRRFSMRPGLTCLWQVNGRNSVRFYDWMKLDLEYIDTWSVLLDFKIMLKTVPVILRATGQ